MAGIFISYRRSDSAAMCDRIYAALAQHFGKDAIFKDIDNIPLGVNFADYIRGVLAQSAVVLVVIGRTWLDVTDEQGHRRLDNPGDFVRLEIEEALVRNIPVIPLRVDGAPMPHAEQLPTSLRGLLTQNGWEVHYDPYFETDIRHVKTGLERLGVPSLQARLAEYARQQETARQAALSTVGPTSYSPEYTTGAPATYPGTLHMAPSRLQSPIPRGRVLSYGAAFGVTAAVIATLLLLLDNTVLHLRPDSPGGAAFSNIVSAVLLVVSAIPGFLIKYRYDRFWAGVRAALLAGLLAWPGYALGGLMLFGAASLSPGNPGTTPLALQDAEFIVFLAIIGVPIGGVCGAVGGVAAMLWAAVWRRIRPAHHAAEAQPVAAASQATTDTQTP